VSWWLALVNPLPSRTLSPQFLRSCRSSSVGFPPLPISSPHVEITDTEKQRVEVANAHYDNKITEITDTSEKQHQELDASHAEAFKALERKQRTEIDTERRAHQEEPK
jgi:hypothetical protein